MALYLPVRSFGLIGLASLAVLCAYVAGGAEPESKEATEPKVPRLKIDGKKVHLPGLVIDLENRCVDLEATVCLNEGMLELVACTKGTKDHESIVNVKARPMHIHTALLLIGANNGHPAMSRPIDEERARWMHAPPRGDPVDVYLVVKDENDKAVERPISDFVTRAEDEFAPVQEDEAKKEEDAGFPKTFLFAGSHLCDDGQGKRKYLADVSGHVITIATFGDEVLCLPGFHDKGNGELVWEVDDTHLPAVGTKVTLRFRLQAKPDPKAKKPLPDAKP